MKREDLRVKRTKKLLLDAMASLMQTTPYSKLTVNDICERAMVHRATFYNHFKDKDDLLNYALDEIQEQMFEAATKTTPTDSREIYLTLAGNLIDFITEKREELKLVLKNSREKVLTMSAQTIRQSMKYIVSRQKDAAKYALPVDVAIDFITGGVTMVLEGQLSSEKPRSKEELMKFFSILLNEKLFLKKEDDGEKK